MTDVTPEQRAEWREWAKRQTVTAALDVSDWPEIALRLLDALDTAEARLAAAEREALERSRRTRIDVCANCGDLVIADGDADYWAHYRGPGSRLNRCQHTVTYGHDATPAHDGAYFIVRDLMPRKDGEP